VIERRSGARSFSKHRKSASAASRTQNANAGNGAFTRNASQSAARQTTQAYHRICASSCISK
jgi:hypothetical protein